MRDPLRTASTRGSTREYLTSDQVAERLGVSRMTVKRLVDAGDLVALKVGARGLLRFTPADLERYIAEHTTGARP